MSFGVSLFALNPTLMRDPDMVLTRLRDAGYTQLEPVISLYDIPPLAEHLWKMEDLAPRREMFARYGFSISSCHVFAEDVAAALPAVLPELKANGIRSVVLPAPTFGNLEEGKQIAEKLRVLAVMFAAEGLELLLHNGDDASIAKAEGMTAYEWMLHTCGGAVGAQVDIGWLLFGGEDPETFLTRNAAQIRSLHYKDMERTPDGMREIAIGKGIADMDACFRFAREQGIPQLADQDGSRGDIVVDLTECGAQLRALSEKY